ncbi:TPA: DUF551 domain-containing protein [Klebsiella pneumoniae]
MVPKEMTDEIGEAIAMQAVLVYRPKAHEGGDSDVRVAVYGRHNFEHGFGCYWEPSHWMPLPAAPQEVK